MAKKNESKSRQENLISVVDGQIFLLDKWFEHYLNLQSLNMLLVSATDHEYKTDYSMKIDKEKAMLAKIDIKLADLETKNGKLLGKAEKAA